MAGQPGFFDGDERLKALSAAGDPLERLAKVVDFEVFRGELEAALSRSDRAKRCYGASGEDKAPSSL
jgi:transposase, IS5 family